MHGFSKQVDRFGNYLFLDMEKGNDIVENEESIIVIEKSLL